MQTVCTPFALAFAKAGKSMPAKIAMMAMTTSSSINVKPPFFFMNFSLSFIVWFAKLNFLRLSSKQ